MIFHNCNTFKLLLNLAFIHQQELAIHLFHSPLRKMLAVRVIKEFNLYGLRQSCPFSKRQGGNCPRDSGAPDGDLSTIAVSGVFLFIISEITNG